jgi:predicted HD phosphohydrolase
MSDDEHREHAHGAVMATAQFHSMDQGTRQDWAAINRAMKPYIAELPDRILQHLRLLDGDCGGFAIDRLQHCLQTATRAQQDGRDEEYVVCALLHDLGDTLGPRNHADVAAAILKPFVSERNHWMVEKHAIFQGYYFFHHLGLDRNMRDQFRDHPWFDYTEEFCRLYDGPAFDPKFKALPLEAFEPLVQRVMTNVKNSIYVPSHQSTKPP